MASYDIDYAISRLRQAIDYAEEWNHGEYYIDARLWVNEVEKSYREDIHSEGIFAKKVLINSDFMLTTLRAVAAGVISPQAAQQRLLDWVKTGCKQDEAATPIQIPKLQEQTAKALKGERNLPLPPRPHRTAHPEGRASLDPPGVLLCFLSSPPLLDFASHARV